MRTAITVLSALMLAACANAPDTRTPETALPAAYPTGDTAQGTVSPMAPDWWTSFSDPTLNRLVDGALLRNADLRLAVARIDETMAVLGLARSALWPGLDLDAAATRSRSSALNGQPVPASGPESTTHRMALSTSFEIDLWGRLRNATAGAQAQLLAAEHARDTVRLAVAGGTAQSYFALRALDAQLVVLDAQLSARRDSLQITEQRLMAGAASTLERAQARTALAATAAQQPALARQRAQLAHQLGQLTGELALTIAPDGAALPLPAAVPPGLPSALLSRRPDVKQAEAALRAAQAQVAVARAAMFPTLSLNGSFGGQSADLVDLLKGGARIWSFGPSLLLPLFDGGRNAQRSAQAQAQAEQAAIQYQRAAQTAFREVADALSAVEQGAREEAAVEVQLAAVTDALRLSRLRHEAGYSGYLEVLEAQRGVQDAQLAQLRARQGRLDASVVLMKALGGGWTATR